MKAEHARKIADQALESLSAALRQGRSEALAKYLAMLARFHNYSFGNVMLILWQRPEAAHVAGVQHLEAVRSVVRKGEKGIVHHRADGHPSPGRGQGRSGRCRGQPVLRFRGVHVFDVSQTDGEVLPEPPRVSGDPSLHLDRIRALVTERGIKLDHDDLPIGADGVSRGGRISVRAGLDAAHEFSVTVHELAMNCSTAREDRKAFSKTVRETEAEAVAFVVCQAIGLEVGTAASDYIKLYNGNTETLAGSLDRIQKISAEIIAGLHSSPVDAIRQ